jgi:predicted dehydrogenase
MLNIGIIGCGNWSKKILSEIEINKNYHLTSMVCRCNSLQEANFKNKIRIFKSIESLFNANINDCIYVAGTPDINLKITEHAKKNKIPLILEKPLSNNYKNAKRLQYMAKKNELLILPNLSNFFSESFVFVKNFIEENFNQIQKIIIYEGGDGPFRKKIHPIWDWGFHSFSTVFKLFENNQFSKVNKLEIKNNKIQKKGVITKFTFSIDSKFEVKIVTGNLFRNKIRKVKVILKNHNVLENNLINHEVFFNKKLVFQNSTSPIQSLLNKFNNEIVSEKTNLSQKLITASCKTTQNLENFYNC